MSISIKAVLRRAGVPAALALTMWAAPLASRADTVASLLGDFTINQYCGLHVADRALDVHYAVVLGQLPALRELHQADANGDGVTTQEERDAYVSRLAPTLADKLKVTLDGTPVPLHAVRWTTSLPKEQSGFSMRIDIDFSAPLAIDGARDAPRRLDFSNQNFAGRIGWHEIAVDAASGVKVFDTDAFGSSLTGGLTEALQALPANGPLDERVVHMRFTGGAVPEGARMLSARGDAVLPTQTSATPPPVGAASQGWLPEQTARLIRMISSPDVPLHIALLALLAAAVLGALHALSPGHGKSIVGAYLVGSRGTPRHAVFLGATVTITHTLVVFALGLGTLFASQFIVPERLLPMLSLVSGLLVFGMGLVLLAQRWQAVRGVWRPQGVTPGFQAAHHGLALSAAHGQSHGHSHDHSHGHDHDHAHGHHSHAMHSHADVADHAHGHDHGAVHSHGGSAHSHLPPGAAGEAVTWRGLLALGVSGGLLPCPSAMVLLLAAVALNKTLFGLLLVLAFSVGLAVTLTAVGLAFLYARNRFQGRLGSARWVQFLPVLSAGAITLLGAVLCFGTLATSPL